MTESTPNPLPISSKVWIIICSLISFRVLVMAVQTVRRMLFPWDTYLWPESPFLTDMWKLHQHLAVYGPPADANSFVYAPGLEYLCHLMLSPFGLDLDIRYCRMVSIAFGVLAALCAAWVMKIAAEPPKNIVLGRMRFFAGFGIVLLVLSKNMMWELCHPDNLHAFHALSVFFLCYAALETKRFGLAVATMIWAGVGVFTKQTEALSFLGPAIVFAHYDPWGWRRWIIAVASGVTTAVLAICLLWSPHYARFYTYELLAHQPVAIIGKFSGIIGEVIVRDRGLLLYLSVIGGIYLWGAGEKARRYVVCWIWIGLFCVIPNISALAKAHGNYNNIIIFEAWLATMVWPFFVRIVDKLEQTKLNSAPAGSELRTISTIAAGLCVLLVFLVLLLKPIKLAPEAQHYQYCQNVEDAVRKDGQSGLKVLVSHGTEFLLRAGITNVPLDRGNSVLELDTAGMASLAGTQSRIGSRYYDRIYLLNGEWYGQAIVQEIEKDYVVERVIKGPPFRYSFPYIGMDYGFQEGLMGDCQILVPRRNAEASQPR